jgi:Secretion system C-terminal sorting domain
MNYFKSILIAGGFTLGLCQAQAQVEFKVERMGESNNFMVYAVATETYSNPSNLVSTAQVTLVAPTRDFQLDKIVNLYPNAKWRVNGRTDAPKENPNQDYIYFGLENLGTDALTFKKGTETPLFLIQSKTCASSVSLMDNTKDAFKYPNSRQINVGNQMTILGAGGDAFKGIVKGKQTADCIKNKISTLDPYQLRVSPNVTAPTVVKVEFFRNDKESEKSELAIFDGMGRAIIVKDLTAQKGYNAVEVDCSNFPNGIYYLMLSGLKAAPITERIIITE